jgi:hypothetical protein
MRYATKDWASGAMEFEGGIEAGGVVGGGGSLVAEGRGVIRNSIWHNTER